MFAAYNEELLKSLASKGEMPIREFLLKVNRPRNDYTDFYGVSAMLHGGYISTDTTHLSDGKMVRGTLGIDTKSTSIVLCQIALEPGQSFIENELPRESWHDFSAKVFITTQGLLKLEEINENNSARSQKRFDYVFAIFIAILAAAAGGIATSYFSPPPSCNTTEQVSGL
jgi:hypothetical protein